MKIAIFHELSFGGAMRAAVSFAEGLRAGHEVDFYYVDEKRDKMERNIAKNIYFFQFNGSDKTRKNWKNRLYADTLSLWKLRGLHKQIAKQINQQRYDIVFIHPSKFTQAPFLLRFVKTKKIYYCQEPLRIVYDPFLSQPSVSIPKKLYEKANRFLRKKIDQKNISYADLILANSSYSVESIYNAYKKRAVVCYLGVDTILFHPSEVEKKYDILFVGEKVPIEGYDLLEKSLRFFKQKPKVRIVSRGENGRGISDQELILQMNKSKIIVALSRNEPFGLLPIEAMACGVPVVAINEGGLVESVKHNKTGILVDPDPEKIYEAIHRKILADKKLRIKFGQEGRREAEKNWTWGKSIERFENIIDNEI